MLEHHKVWLECHPKRTAEWLDERVKEGFDVHHLDGNHQNNEPTNLVLIEHTDHMMIHSSRHAGRLRRVGSTTPKGPSINDPAYCERAYTLRNDGLTWREVGNALGVTETKAERMFLRYDPTGPLGPKVERPTHFQRVPLTKEDLTPSMDMLEPPVIPMLERPKCIRGPKQPPKPKPGTVTTTATKDGKHFLFTIHE